MEKNNTTTSTFSICRKIRQVFGSNPAFKTINRTKKHNHEPKPQQINIVNIEGRGGGGGGTMIPIMYDYSMVHEHVSKVSSPHIGISERKGELATDSRLAKSEIVAKGNGKPLKVGLVNLEKQGKKSLDINDVFSEYIQREKTRIKTVSNVGKGQSNSVLDEDNSFDKMKNQNDDFSDFIVQAKKRIRTTSNIGKTIV